MAKHLYEKETLAIRKILETHKVQEYKYDCKGMMNSRLELDGIVIPIIHNKIIGRECQVEFDMKMEYNKFGSVFCLKFLGSDVFKLIQNMYGGGHKYPYFDCHSDYTGHSSWKSNDSLAAHYSLYDGSRSRIVVEDTNYLFILISELKLNIVRSDMKKAMLSLQETVSKIGETVKLIDEWRNKHGCERDSE